MPTKNDERKKDFINALLGAGQGLSFDFGDEMYGAGRGAYDSYQSGTPYAEEYEKRRNEARDILKRAETESPIAFRAGDIASSFLPIPGTQAKLATKAMPLARKILQAAGLGALGGAGRSEAEDLGGIAGDTAQSAAMSAGTVGLTDQALRRMGDVIDFKKAKKALERNSDKQDDSWFQDRVERLEKDHPKSRPKDPVREILDNIVDKYEKDRTYGNIDNTWELRQQKIKEARAPEDFETYSRNWEAGQRYLPEDVMNDLEAKRLDLFQDQVNYAGMLDKLEEVRSLPKDMKKSEDYKIFVGNLADNIKNAKQRQKNLEKEIAKTQGKVDKGELIPGVNRGPLTKEEERAIEIAEMVKGKRFKNKDEAAAYLDKRDKAWARSDAQREKKRANDKLESQFDREVPYYIDDDIRTWPKREVPEESASKIVGRSRDDLRVLNSVDSPPMDFETYARLLEAGKAKRSPLEAIRDMRELEKYRLFRDQAKATDMQDILKDLQEKLRNEWKGIKNRSGVKTRVESISRKISDKLGRPWQRRRDEDWNPSDD